MEQGTDEWFQARLGKITASRIADVMAKGRNGAPSVTRKNYIAQLVAERLSGRSTETFTSAAMQHGTDTEPQARAMYTLNTGNPVQEVGFIDHPTLAMSGASPDGKIPEDDTKECPGLGLIEIKCPNTATHINTLRGGNIDRKYILQMQWQMACTGARWCDFVSFDPRMPDELQMHVQRVEFDAHLALEIQDAIAEALAEVEAICGELTQKVAA